jgi:predicted transcriptional regulator of viral defense system
MLSTGVEFHSIDGVEVPITSVARTVCDAFRFRRHVGLDVAIESLRDALEQGATPGEITDVAARTRIGSVLRPYLEALS